MMTKNVISAAVHSLRRSYERECFDDICLFLFNGPICPDYSQQLTEASPARRSGVCPSVNPAAAVHTHATLKVIIISYWVE